MWLHMHGINHLVFMSVVCMCGPIPEVTQSTTIHIKLVPPVSGLLSSVQAQTSATRASTSVVFAPGFNILHYIDLREIFECAHLKFTVSGLSKHKYTHACAMQSH